jgi:hypothetical protein
MEFLIADTFTDSLAKLSNVDQKLVKTTVFDLQLNPSSPGMQFHRIDKSKDENFWSVRVNRDLRVILHKTSSSLLICYTAHHDRAYHWTKQRKIEVHPKTGAAQLVKIRETVKEIVKPQLFEKETQASTKSQPYKHLSKDELLLYGVPEEWLDDVLIADENSILNLAEHLPSEAAEALLEIAIGNKPEIRKPANVGSDPFNHPDAQRRFRTMSNVEELERALDFPWEKWSIFLHPDQKHIVDKDNSGPARVSGSAGTGKTIVALHRAVHLTRTNSDGRVLLTTFSKTLASTLQTKLSRLISNQPRIGEQLEVHALNDIGLRLYELNIGKPNIINKDAIHDLIKEASFKASDHKFSLRFLISEWNEIVDAWQIETWEAYREVRRLGRKSRLHENQRKVLWNIFEKVCSRLKENQQITISGMFNQLFLKLSGSKNPPFDHVIIDEAQDISIAQLRFVSTLTSNKPNSVFFAGDLGQRIFQKAFSWKSLGIDIRGRSRTLKINYRTSHQIRKQADLLLASEITDVDGNKEERDGTISVFNGPKPEIISCDTIESEKETAKNWISEKMSENLKPNELGIFVRSEAEVARGCAVLEKSGLAFKVLDGLNPASHDQVSLCTMHLAKGLEFRAVVIMACDDEIIPLQKRIESSSDEKDLEEVYNTERHLLYVACTRARDYLLITGVDPTSEFLDDMAI